MVCRLKLYIQREDIMKRLVCVLASALTACGWTGLDAKLDTSSELLYRISRDKAFKDMTAEQQDGFNWAVGHYTLYSFFAKYPNATPRKVISAELNTYEQFVTHELEGLKANFSRDTVKLKAQDDQIAAMQSEASKIVMTHVNLRVNWSHETEVIFATKNDSQFDVSEARWTLQVYFKGQDKPAISCPITARYWMLGGLSSGASNNLAIYPGSDCRGLNSPQVQDASWLKLNMKVEPESILDIDKKPIVPRFEITTADYEHAIAEKMQELEWAGKLREAL